MKIAERFPQFRDAPCMLLVAGRQNARFLRVYKGYLYELRSIFIPNPHYSDHEGFFLTRGKVKGTNYGIVTHAGAVYEFPEDAIVQDFIHALTKNTYELISLYKISEIILFAPSYMKNIIVRALPRGTQAKIHNIIEGIYYDAHPFDLLRKIKKRRDEERIRKMPIDPYAQKILKRPHLRKSH